MHTEPLKSLNIHHTLADITIAPHASVPANVLKQLICSALDNYREDVILEKMIAHETMLSEIARFQPREKERVGLSLDTFKQR